MDNGRGTRGGAIESRNGGAVHARYGRRVTGKKQASKPRNSQLLSCVILGNLLLPPLCFANFRACTLFRFGYGDLCAGAAGGGIFL